MRCPLMFSSGGGDCIESKCAWWADGCVIPQCTAKAMLREEIQPPPIIIPKQETDKMQIRKDGTDAKGMDDLKPVTTSEDFKEMPERSSEETDGAEILNDFCPKCGRVLCRTESGDVVCTNLACAYKAGGRP